MIRISGEQYEVDKFIEESLDCLKYYGECKGEKCLDCKIRDHHLEVTYDKS